MTRKPIDALRFLHYSASPFVFDNERVYTQTEHHKPVGMWLSVEGEHCWRSFCEGEDLGLDGLAHVNEVTLEPDANILLIDTLAKLDAFHRAYNKGLEPKWESRNIHWPNVVALYDGLIISPYRWERRLDYMWYYGWDCASGVIWNLRSIERVAPLTEVTVS